MSGNRAWAATSPRTHPLSCIFLVLLARVLSILWISHAAGICRPDVAVFNDKLETTADIFKSHEALGGK